MKPTSSLSRASSTVCARVDEYGSSTLTSGKVSPNIRTCRGISTIAARQRSLGLTAILVTHDQEEALATADRLVVMNDGRIEQVGTPSQVFEAPRSRFVADCIGVASLLPGRVAESGLLVLEGGEQVRVAGPSPGAAALLAMRPERLLLLPDAAGRHANEMPRRVRSATCLGTVSEYHVELPSGARLVSRQANPGGGGEPRFCPGDAVCVARAETASRLVAAE